jgi:membrane protease subunit HflK
LGDIWRRFLPPSFRGAGSFFLAGAAILVVWGLSGFYRVQPDEQGVEFLFGAYAQSTEPGLHYWLPSPIGSVVRPKVTLTNQVAIGFRAGPERVQNVPDESLILTGDQNIADIHAVVQWRINSASAFLFNLRDPAGTIKIAAESALREVVGSRPLTAVMTNERDDVASDVGRLLQGMLDSYGAGVTVLDVRLQKADPPAEVLDAFNDVQRAKQDADRFSNEALAYRNRIVPAARGDAARAVQAAAGEKEKLIREAQGQASRFTAFYDTYAANREITARRLYLETMEDIVKRSTVIVVDKNSPGIVPYLPLRSASKPATAPVAAPPAAPEIEENP